MNNISKHMMIMSPSILVVLISHQQKMQQRMRTQILNKPLQKQVLLKRLIISIIATKIQEIKNSKTIINNLQIAIPKINLVSKSIDQMASKAKLLIILTINNSHHFQIMKIIKLLPNRPLIGDKTLPRVARKICYPKTNNNNSKGISRAP